MRHFIVWSFYLVISAGFLQAQPAKLDSLIERLKVYGEEDTVKVDLQNAIAFEYAHSNPKLLRDYANESLSLARTLDYKKGIARALNVIASSFWVEGEYNLGLDYYMRSLRIYEEIDDKQGIFVCYNNMGEIYKKIKNFDAALAYHEQALTMKIKYLRQTTPVMSYINIAEVYLALGSVELAKDYFQRARVLSEESENKRALAYAYSGLGETLLFDEKYDSAILFFERAIQLRKLIHDVRGLATTLQLLGNAHFKTNKLDLAESKYFDSNLYARQIGAKDLELQAIKCLFSVDSSRGDYLRALKLNYKYNQLKDSLFNLEKERQLARIQTIYNVEKKEKANALLLKDKKANEAMIKYQTVINIGVALGVVLFGVMSFILYKQREQKNEANYLLKLRNEEINKQKDALEESARELKDLNLNLEKKVEQRTQVINKKNQKLREYAFMNAHNVRGPLTNILSLTQLLETLNSKDDHKEIIRHLHSSAEKLDNVIHDIKDNLENEELP